MEFSLNAVFVVPTGNSLPVAGTTATLTPGQVGIFLPNYTPATAATAASASKLFVAEGRPNDNLNLKNFKSNFFSSRNVISQYLIEGSATATEQITEVSDFAFKCGNSYSLTVRGWSRDINASYFNGMTVPITVQAPCCDCDADPCEPLGADETQALVEEIADKINEHSQLSPYVTATTSGTGLDTVLTLTGVLIEPNDPPYATDPYTLTPAYDAFRFDVFVEEAAPTTQDLYIPTDCNVVATVEKTQNVSFPVGTPDQVRKIEREWFGYKLSQFKTQYRDYHYNLMFQSKVEDIPFYDQIYIRFRDDNSHLNFGNFANLESGVSIFTPPALTAGIQAIIEANIGDLEEKS